MEKSIALRLRDVAATGKQGDYIVCDLIAFAEASEYIHNLCPESTVGSGFSAYFYQGFALLLLETAPADSMMIFPDWAVRGIIKLLSKGSTVDA